VAETPVDGICLAAEYPGKINLRIT